MPKKNDIRTVSQYTPRHIKRFVSRGLFRPALSSEAVRQARRKRIARIKNQPPFHSDSDLAFEAGFDAAKDFQRHATDIFAGIATALDLGLGGTCFLAWREGDDKRLLFASAGTDPAGFFGGQS